jgi:hypothetical protein
MDRPFPLSRRKLRFRLPEFLQDARSKPPIDYIICKMSEVLGPLYCVSRIVEAAKAEQLRAETGSLGAALLVSTFDPFRTLVLP